MNNNSLTYTQKNVNEEARQKYKVNSNMRRINEENIYKAGVNKIITYIKT